MVAMDDARSQTMEACWSETSLSTAGNLVKCVFMVYDVVLLFCRLFISLEEFFFFHKKINDCN